MKAVALTYVPGVADRLPGKSRTQRSLLTRIRTWSRVARERRRLLDLDPRMLADIGPSPEDAAREASRPFWDVDPAAFR